MKEKYNKLIKNQLSKSLVFTIDNFRVFNTPTTFELAPITILTGPNNSGKSSLVKSLILLNENKKDERLRNHIDFMEPKIKLFGSNNTFCDLNKSLNYSFDHVIKELNNLKIRYNFSFNSSGFLESFCINYKQQKLLIYNYHRNSFPVFDVNFNLPKLIKLLKVDGPLFNYVNGNDQLLGINTKLNNSCFQIENEVINNFVNVLSEDSKDPLDGLFAEFAEEKNSLMENHFILENRYSTITEINEALISQIFNYLKLKIQFEIEKRLLSNTSLELSDQGKKLFSEILLLIRSFDVVLYEINIRNVPINRNVQNRNIDLTNNEILLNILLKNYIENIDDKDDWFFGPWINPWLEKFGIGKGICVESYNFEIANVFIFDSQGKKRDISACGTGVIQIITLLLLPLSKNSVLEHINQYISETNRSDIQGEKIVYYLEEPESNLHPNWQSLLMELIIDIHQRFGIRFIIETHSEYMIRKAQNFTAKKECLNDDFVIYYFNNQEHRIKLGIPVRIEIKIKENGLLNQSFGPGFFDEAGKLSLELLSLNSISKN
jgi:AAA15 family ATPase/GTPase